MQYYCQMGAKSRVHALPYVAFLLGMLMTFSSMNAQSVYSYLPTASTTDGRFFSIAGAGFQTLGDNPLIFKIAMPAGATTLEIGIFDGETGGAWDQGTVPLQYTLYADPAGDATGTIQLGQWLGSSMPDTAWYSVSMANSSQARCGDGDFFYVLRIQSTNRELAHWSSFKLRTNGTLVALRNTNIAYTAPMASLADARCIYPNWPTTSGATYDGEWNLYMDVPVALPALTIWDGDMDRGSYDCSDNDTDDEDTPNGTIPSWASNFAVPEGVPTTSIECVNASGAATGGYTTSNPPDNSRNAVFQRGTGVSYEVVTPSGTHFANTNPSGNLEWEAFTLSTAAFDRSQMDYHADALPAGIYRIHASGVDMSNLNAWRLPYDAVGVDASGVPVSPIRPDYTNGVISGLVYYETSGNTSQEATEPGIPSITVILAADYDNNGSTDATLTTETDADGHYTFAGLRKGTYVITVDVGTLADDAVAVWDTDSLSTRNVVSGSLTQCTRTSVGTFGYKRVNVVATGTRTRGYWVNHPDVWPVNTLRLGALYYNKQELMAILERPTRGDKTYQMAAQLIATKLNLAAGCEASCVADAVAAADAWLTTYPVGAKQKSWSTSVEATHKTLDDYNNGRLCVGHMN